MLEVSLDVPLVQNALELVLDNSDHLLPDVCIYEYEKSEVVVLFATTTTAYRLLLPHPEKIVKVRRSSDNNNRSTWFPAALVGKFALSV